eukprot:NODE_8095_length_1523_cov_13.472779.p1 GENE.NODE_8095_length_1523_cov_13.472779~~NODE_8095_length_1523_cov_13.472779.p1  ORF type:complete len:415 (+),score=118.40 NODE_8095_length_1523_cov_13.472779:106-1350(+)
MGAARGRCGLRTGCIWPALPSLLLPLPLLLLLLLLLLAPAAAARSGRPRLHLITYSNTVDPRLSLSLGSAQRFGMYPVVVGLGLQAEWAVGLSAMANMLRDYIFNSTEADDLVMFFDAFDVVFQAREAAIVDKYLELEAREGRTLFYNAESHCSSKRVSEYPPSSLPWRYLNSGIYIGRSYTLRDVFRYALPEHLVDRDGKPERLQNWHTDYFLDHQNSTTLDYKCELTQVVFNIDNLHVNQAHTAEATKPGGHGLILEDGLMHNTITGTVPLMLHFAGVGHWPDSRHAERVGTCAAYEYFRAAGHPDFVALLEQRMKRKFFGMPPWKAMCTNLISMFDRMAMSVSTSGDFIIWAFFRALEHPFWLFLIIVLVAVQVHALVRHCGCASTLRKHAVMQARALVSTWLRNPERQRA